MGNKNGNYEVLSEETKDLLMQRTGEASPVYITVVRLPCFVFGTRLTYSNRVPENRCCGKPPNVGLGRTSTGAMNKENPQKRKGQARAQIP